MSPSSNKNNPMRVKNRVPGAAGRDDAIVLGGSLR